LSVFFLSREWFVVYKVGEYKGFLIATGLAALLGLGIIIVDLITIFPADTNRPFPDSLFFYPIFGFVVEVIFHLLPLALLLLGLSEGSVPVLSNTHPLHTKRTCSGFETAARGVYIGG